MDRLASYQLLNTGQQTQIRYIVVSTFPVSYSCGVNDFLLIIFKTARKLAIQTIDHFHQYTRLLITYTFANGTLMFTKVLFNIHT